MDGCIRLNVVILFCCLSITTSSSTSEGQTKKSGTELMLQWFKSRSLHTKPLEDYQQNLKLQSIPSADVQNATCMDGSNAGYYVSNRVQSPNWIIHLQAGGSCTTWSECHSRTQSPLGSSRYFEKIITGEYVLSDDPKVNPAFHSWTKVLIPYCSGDVFVGRKQARDHPLGLSMTGHYIVTAVIRELIRVYGINNNEAKILFGGTSAGGIGVLANIDHVRNMLEPADVRSYNDGGWFSMLPNFGEKLKRSEKPKFSSMLSTLFTTFWDGFVDESCRKQQPPSLCLYGEIAVPFIKTPMYVMSPRWDTYQMTKLIAHGYRIVHLPPKRHKHRKYISNYANHTFNALREVMRYSKNGVYSPACFSHAFLASCSDDSICYFPPSNTFQIQGRTAYQGLAEWYRSDGVKGSYVDNITPRTACNPSCCSHLCHKCHHHRPITKQDVTLIEKNEVEILPKDEAPPTNNNDFFTLKVFQMKTESSKASRLSPTLLFWLVSLLPLVSMFA